MGKTYMTAEELCQAARAMVGKYTYDEVDCIRVIQNPLEKAGVKFAYTGSNWFARNEVSNLRRLTSQGQLRPGVALFRSREPAESGYALPERYMQSKNAYNAALGETDFHHIGLMLENGEIVDSNKDSKRDGPAISTKWQAWEWVADIEGIDYGETGTPHQPPSAAYSPQGEANTGGEGGETAMKTAIVTSGGKGAVNFRQGPGTGYDFSFKHPSIPEGATVEVLETKGDWSRVTYQGETGWVKTGFLSSDVVQNSNTETESGTVQIPRETALAFYNTLGNVLGK